MAEAQAGEIVIKARVPSITSENVRTLTPEKMERQWNLLAEVVRQAIQTKPELREALIKFCTEPVSETTPKEFINLLSEKDPRTGDLYKRYDSEIGAYLNLPPVPDEEIKPDIRNAPRLNTPEDEKRYLRDLYGEGDPQVQEGLSDDIKYGKFSHGITKEEGEMVAKRYGFARDVKILSLAGEILNQEELVPNEKGEIILPSGIKIVLDINGENNERVDLLNPHLWERRRQFKDRVYEIEVNGRKYILKEKKTARHTDTKQHGHVDGRLSSEEFAIAKDFEKDGEAEEDGIKLSWEKPVGFVSYPDGFQFAVFNYENGLISINEITQKLEDQIVLHREQFEENFKLISNISKKYKNDPRVLAFEKNELLKRLVPPRSLTFEEYARIKAFRMEQKARFLMSDTIIKKGFSNRDMDGYAYKIYTNGKVELQIIGFDFEYFKPIPQKEIQGDLDFAREFRIQRQKAGIIGGRWGYKAEFTRMEKAAYLAMLEAEGKSY